jgi:Family of unknown function (DUF6441)
VAAQFKVTVDQPAWLKMIREKQRSVATASVAALREASDDAVEEGRSDIAGAGRFGPRWQSGLKRRMVGATEDGEPSLQAKAIIFHKFGFAGVFEHGAVIEGKPLLWIPTQEGGPAASRSGKTLTSATVRGQPMLFDANDKDRERKPLYVGVKTVVIEPKWNITDIVKKNAARLGELFLKHFKDK